MEGRSVAALVYSRRSHIINLFVRPTDAGGTGPHATVIRGYNIVSWSVEGMQFWAVSDLNLTELEQFQRFVSPPNTAL
jgi:anti-sigma factor RsiW